MVYNTENGASLQKLPHKSQISGKIVDIIVENWKKRKQNTKCFTETTQVDYPEPLVKWEQAGLEQ